MGGNPSWPVVAVDGTEVLISDARYLAVVTVLSIVMGNFSSLPSSQVAMQGFRHPFHRIVCIRDLEGEADQEPISDNENKQMART